MLLFVSLLSYIIACKATLAYFVTSQINLNQLILFNDFKYTFQSTDIYLDDKNILTVDAKTFSGLNLHWIDLGLNLINQIDYSTFNGLDNLEELKISYFW